MPSQGRSPTLPGRGPLAQSSNSTQPANAQTASIPHHSGGRSRTSPSSVSLVADHMAGSFHFNTQSVTRRLPLSSGTPNTPSGNSPPPRTSPLRPNSGHSARSNVPARTNGARGLPSSPQNRSVPVQPQQHLQQRPQQRGTTAPLTGAVPSSAQSLTLDLFGLPKDIKIREIWESLNANHLSPVRVEICENVDGSRTGKARVLIEPPPTRWPTWSGPADFFTVTRADSSKVRVLSQARPYYVYSIRTPCDKEIPPQLCQKKFPSRKLMFGMMAGESTMWNLPQFSYEDVVLLTDFSKRRFEIQFKANVGRYGLKVFKMQIDFSHPTKIIWGTRKNGAWGLAMLLPSPPKLYGRLPVSHDDDQLLWQEWDLWGRQTDISGELHKLKDIPARIEKPVGQFVEFGRWTTYYCDMDSFLSEWESVRTYLADYNVKIVQVDSFELVNPGVSNAWKLLDYSTEMTLELLGSTNTYHLDFPVRYQLEVCISHGLLDEYSIDAQFLERLVSFDADRARMMLEGIADANRKFFEPLEMFDDPKVMHYWPNARVPPYATLVRRAVITPTAIYFKTPCVELTNRILRKYSDLNDRFLRVQFTDEVTFGKIFSSQDSTKDDNLFTRVHRVLRNGIIIGDRHYRFLAFSNSQFRENGAFFFCDTDHVTCDSIREWMGDFRHIRSVGKFAARMGQCFTTTRQVNGISIPKIRQIGDIQRQTGDHIWNFTDGVGKISHFFATLIANERDLPETPSCFQIRMGGCKGVVVAWPDVPASEVHVRPSQEKFKAVYNGLEIIKTSTFSHATLNKQVIPVLVALGVDNSVFVSMLDSELEEYDEALTDSMRAGGLLRSQVDENQTTLTMAEMVDTFMDFNEPFLWTLLRLWKCWVLKRLKSKFAISVKNSAMVFGVVDEIGVLRGHSQVTEGRKDNNVDLLPQIFLQVPIKGSDGRNTTDYEVITGICVVGRNPSLHPGDVRVVEAVDASELRHLKNVVVFPRTGDRDIPSMCSGGDMDGDDYFVYWDERLVPPEWHHPPLDHDADSSTPGLDKPEDVTIEDVTRFFAQYMKNDSLGRIATAHFAQADRWGVKHPKCIELAKLHSKAVDYIKSGKPAVMQRHLQPRTWPHWMEKDKKPSYYSSSALGQIYDRIKIEEFHAAYEMPFDARILSRFQLEEDTLVKAGKIKAAYDIAMRRLMGQHEAPVTEFEIWSTFILSKPRVGSDYKLQENVGREMAALKERFRADCMAAVTGDTQMQRFTFSSSMANLEKLDRFVAAMYTVTHNEVRAAARERSTPKSEHDGGLEEVQTPLISFPWLFHRELARVALGRGGDVRPLQISVWQNQDEEQQRQQTNGGDPTDEDGEFDIPGDKVSPDTIDLEGETQQPLQDVQSKKEGYANERGDSAADGEIGEDYVRTSGGQVVQRGQMLTLFTETGEEVKGQQDAMSPTTSPAAGSISSHSLIADESTGSSPPASPRSGRGSDEEYQDADFEELNDADYGEEKEDALEALNVAPRVEENITSEAVVPADASLGDDVDGLDRSIPSELADQTFLSGQDRDGPRTYAKRPGGGRAKKNQDVVPVKDFDEAFGRVINLLPSELEVRGLLQPLDGMTGEARLRELGIRTRRYKKYLEAWEDLHLVPDSEGGTYIRDDVIQYIHGKHRTTSEQDGSNDLAETIHAYESYRQLLVQLSELLFPFTAPYFPDHMTLRSHIQKGGRGIALTAGNDQVAYLLTQIPILRRLGCDLPIEVMYGSDADLNRDSRQDLEDLEGVVTRDIGAMVRDKGWTLAGWAIKPFAILLSSFREVIFIDSDSFFFRNPEVMFDDPGYVKTGALFFRDRLIMPELRRSWLQSILPQPVSRNVKQSRLWTGDSGHQQESGVLVIDTYRHFMAMLLVTRMNGPDRDGNRDDKKVGVYDMVYGDKETFWLGFELVGDTDYVFHQGDTGTLGVMKTREEMDAEKSQLPQWAILDNSTEPEFDPVIDSEFDPEGDLSPAAATPSPGPLPSQRMCAPQLLHLDLEGKPFWFNGGLVMNKFLERRQWKFATFESYLIEPRDVREPGAWILGEGNMCCLTTDNHLYGVLTPAEKELTDEMIAQARRMGIARG